MALVQDSMKLAIRRADLSLASRWCQNGCPFSRSVLRVHSRDSSQRHISPDPLHGRKIRENIWREFFSDPSLWWDHRAEKVNPRFPDFKHKKTQQSLWVIDDFNPEWVESKLAAMTPGTVQPHIFSWNERLRRYVKAGYHEKTMEHFQLMQREGITPDMYTFLPVLNACSGLQCLDKGRHVHQQIIERGFEFDVYVANCLVDMYAKCGSVEEAWSVFNNIRERTVVSWNAIIGGYVKSGQGQKAMELFRKMQQEGVQPDAVTFVGMLNACASVAALEEGRRVHEHIIQRGCESVVYVANCLVDMYAKCGSIEDAWAVFNRMREHTVVSWTVILGGYAMHGHAKKAIELFKRMRQEDVELDGIAFNCLLSACGHGGLVKEGLRYFHSMTSLYNILPTREHYACMVDLLGRAGRLEEAEEMTKKIPMEGDAHVWMSLLGACRIHGNMKMAERAAKRCWDLDPGNASGHLLLSHIYAAAGKRDRSVPAIGIERLERTVWMS